MRNLFSIGLFLILTAFASVSVAHAKYATIVIDAGNGRILHQINANTRNYPASLTKMMTLYMLFTALENGELTKNNKIKFSKKAARQPSTNLRVSAGKKITVENAIKALVVRSANDVAVAVAEHLSGTEAQFAKNMTRKARTLGMKRTNFKNASGLPNKAQLSTAWDMTLLVHALQQNFPQYYHYFSATKFTYNGKTYKGHNKLLKTYKGSDGVKTGYTHASGFNIATSVKRGNTRLIAVMFGGKTSQIRNRHVANLLDKSFSRLKSSGFNEFMQLTHASTPEKLIKFTFKEAPIPIQKQKSQILVAQPSEPQIVLIAQPTEPPSELQKTTQLEPQALAHLAPPVPKHYKQSGLNQTIIIDEPQKISLVQNFKTGKAKYNAGGWSVQVGAYHKLSQATKFFVTILPHVNNQNENVILSQVNKRGRPVYKPRLVGMQEDQAYETCNLLKTKKIDCLVISPLAS